MNERLVNAPLTAAEIEALVHLSDDLRHIADLAARLLPQAQQEVLAAQGARRRLDAERKAWARFVKAAVALEGHASDGYAMDGNEQAEHEAAKRALVDLGVDVDALLSEAAR